MNDELRYILDKYELSDPSQVKLYYPIEIPGFRRVEHLAPLFAELGYTRGVEIGVERGLYSEALCEANPQLQLFSVDPWEHYSGYRDHVSPEKLETFYEDARIRLSPYNCTLVRKYSVDAAEDFENRSLDFVYIDGNHRLQSVIEDIAAWDPKVRKGGIIAGHDFRQFKRQTYCHVVEAVRAWTQSYRIHPWFLGGKRSESKETRDGARSWFWVKQ